MPRDRKELNFLLEDVSRNFKEKFNTPLLKEDVAKFLSNLIEEKVKKELYSRLGHLPEEDMKGLLAFVTEQPSGTKATEKA